MRGAALRGALLDALLLLALLLCLAAVPLIALTLGVDEPIARTPPEPPLSAAREP